MRLRIALCTAVAALAVPLQPASAEPICVEVIVDIDTTAGTCTSFAGDVTCVVQHVTQPVDVFLRICVPKP